MLGHKEFRLRHRNLGALWKPAKTMRPPKSVTVRKSLREYKSVADPGESLRQLVSKAVIDPYKRANKSSRDYPRKKHGHAIGVPKSLTPRRIRSTQRKTQRSTYIGVNGVECHAAPAWLHRSNRCGKMRDSSLISTAVFAVLDANHGVTGSWLRFPVFSVRSWRAPWDSLGLILWRPRPGRFSSEVRRKLIIRTLVEISEESRKCCRTLSKTGLSQHPLAEVRSSLTVASLPGPIPSIARQEQGESTWDPLNACELAPNSANSLIPSLIAWAKSQPPGNVAIVSIHCGFPRASRTKC